MKQRIIPSRGSLLGPLLAGLLALGLAGCGNGAQPGAGSGPSQAVAASQSSETEIRAAIQSHLAHDKNINLQSFDTDVKQVTIQGDHAEAQVDFHVKGGPGVMQLTYQLAKQGGTWGVVESDPFGDSSHPPVNQSEAPGAAATPSSEPDSLADTLRSFKQGAFGAAPNLPAGHPPINSGSGSTTH
jgi:hypothetical protein